MNTKFYIVLVAFLATAGVFAQAPEKMSYQAVVRAADNTLVTNQQVGMQISILETTVTGSAVYVETHTPTTNANGLVTIEIGTGNVASGLFSAIDWATDSFFTKTEIDPMGGTSYSITGTSELLSVPYALQAKTATTATELSGGMNQVYIEALEARIKAIEPKIGDKIYGGVVFWVDPEDRLKGLVCALEDQGTNITWDNDQDDDDYQLIGTGTAIGTGAANTTAILIAQGESQKDYAAGMARAYRGGGYTDWFLPSLDELSQMFLNKAALEAVDGFDSFIEYSEFTYMWYWSSSEYAYHSAWSQYFGNGYQEANGKTPANAVRAVRAF